MERLEAQRRYEEQQQEEGAEDSGDQQQRTPRGVSWEVRKATAADNDGYEPSAVVRDALERASGQGQQQGASPPSTVSAVPEAEEKEKEQGQEQEKEQQEAVAAAALLLDEEDEEVAMATEAVWRETEKWVDDQIQAEEEAWRRLDEVGLGLGDHTQACHDPSHKPLDYCN